MLMGKDIASIIAISSLPPRRSRGQERPNGQEQVSPGPQLYKHRLLPVEHVKVFDFFKDRRNCSESFLSYQVVDGNNKFVRG